MQHSKLDASTLHQQALIQPGWTPLTKLHAHCNSATDTGRTQDTVSKRVALPLFLRDRRKLSLCGFRQGLSACSRISMLYFSVELETDDGYLKWQTDRKGWHTSDVSTCGCK